MPSIKHRIVIESPPKAVYESLTTTEGLSAWWTPAEAEHTVGCIAKFYFGETRPRRAYASSHVGAGTMCRVALCQWAVGKDWRVLFHHRAR
jgi:uncharacterized protein YndB with AHSA1/START domain